MKIRKSKAFLLSPKSLTNLHKLNLHRLVFEIIFFEGYAQIYYDLNFNFVSFSD